MLAAQIVLAPDYQQADLPLPSSDGRPLIEIAGLVVGMEQSLRPLGLGSSSNRDSSELRWHVEGR